MSGSVVGDVFVKLRCAVCNGGLLVDYGRQHLVSDINELYCVVSRLTGLRGKEHDGFADKTNPVHRHYRPVRYDRTRDDPIGLDLADLVDEIRAGDSKTDTRCGARRRKVYPNDPSMRMRRAQDRQIKRARQFDVVDITSSSREKFAILSSAQRVSDIEGRLVGHLGQPSEGLDPGPQLDLQRPGAARLPQHLDISLRDRVGIERAVRTVRRIRPPRAAYAAIDDEMGDVDAFWSQLARR